MFYQAPLAVCVFTVRYVHVWKSQEGSMHVYRVLMSWVIELGATQGWGSLDKKQITVILP